MVRFINTRDLGLDETECIGGADGWPWPQQPDKPKRKRKRRKHPPTPTPPRPVKEDLGDSIEPEELI